MERVTRPGRTQQERVPSREDAIAARAANGWPPGETAHQRDPASTVQRIKRWSDRNQMILYQVLLGRKPKDIALDIGVNPQTITGIINSPLFQVRLAQEREALRTATVAQLLERITAEAGPNFEFLVQMRDNPASHQDDPRVRLMAAKQIEDAVDRVIPKKREVHEERTHHLVIDRDSLDRMQAALREVAAGPPIAVPFKPTTFEEPWPLAEVEAAMQAEEAAADELP